MEYQFKEWRGRDSQAFDVVDMFEQRVAEWAGSKYAVAVATGTWAIFLSCVLVHESYKKHLVSIPCRTFISVPMAIIQAGFKVGFSAMEWKGKYELFPLSIWDGALRWHKGMYKGGLHCLSFHARKSLPIGEGGMILTDNAHDFGELKKLRYSGRAGPNFVVEEVTSMGYQAYMTPEKAARGLHLMEYTQDEPDQVVHYPDLRNVPFFKKGNK